jgi:hypothetical protein
VSAAGNPSSVSINDASVLIRQIQQKVNDLAIQLQSARIQPLATAPVPVSHTLTQSQLDYIKSQTDIIAAETARLRIEVQVFVILRDIRQKTADLDYQITNQQKYAGTDIRVETQSKASNIGNGTVEAQIAKIKQQINELNQELAAKQAADQTATANLGSVQTNYEGQSSLEDSNGQSVSTAPAANKAQEPAKKGFWQSIGDFFKNLFTF